MEASKESSHSLSWAGKEPLNPLTRRSLTQHCFPSLGDSCLPAPLAAPLGQGSSVCSLDRGGSITWERVGKARSTC